MNREDLEKKWERLFVDYFKTSHEELSDASHDLSHFRRVYQTAKCISNSEQTNADPLIILAAAYLHDVVSLPKNHPESKLSSRYSAIKAKEILRGMGFPSEKIDQVCHAVEAHSFSAQLEPQTLEAKIIQDADRMEALGALGVMRTFYVSGRIGRQPYDPDDLRALKRSLDDKAFGLDHFFIKLFKLPDLLKTKGGRAIAKKRVDFLHFFVRELEGDLKKGSGGAMNLVWTCYNAGSESLHLFDALNPFAQDRPLDPARFAVDGIMAAKNEFPHLNILFLLQLQEELELSS